MNKLIPSKVRNIWAILCPYWQSEERWRSGAILGCALFLCVGGIYMEVIINDWRKLWFNAFQNRDFDQWLHLLLLFALYQLPVVITLVGGQYFSQSVQIRWRRWLSEKYMQQWLNEKTYFRLQVTSQGVDNPDQRIAEDLRLLAVDTIDLLFGFIQALLKLCTFVAVLWYLSGVIGGFAAKIPGYLIWVAIVYTLTGSWLAHVTGKALISLDRSQQQLEADYRFSLVRLRENAAEIAAYDGEAAEKQGLSDRFIRATDIWWKIIRRQRNLNWVTTGYDKINFVVPYLFIAYRYFSGAVPLGILIQTVNAFASVRESLSWLITNYSRLASWRATVDRLTSFQAALTAAGKDSVGAKRLEGAAEGGIEIKDLSIRLPDGMQLLDGVTMQLKPGSHTLISGPSGCGKTTFFYAVNNLWPYCSGSIMLPAEAKMLFIPQKPYMPIASLRQAVAYPEPAEKYSDDEIKLVLEQCGLGHLLTILDQQRHWAQQLSPGEQQRLAFARALLVGPQWLFLDEATAALDEASEVRLYKLLFEKLPFAAIVSIAHKPAIVNFHKHRIDLAQFVSKRLRQTEPSVIYVQERLQNC